MEEEKVENRGVAVDVSPVNSAQKNNKKVDGAVIAARNRKNDNASKQCDDANNVSESSGGKYKN